MASLVSNRLNDFVRGAVSTGMSAADQLAKEQSKQQQTAQAMAAVASQKQQGAANNNLDYSVLMQQAMANGAGADEVERLANQRVQKALGTEGLSQYAYDDKYKAAMDYAATLRRQQVPDNTDLINKQYSAQKEADVAAIREAIRGAVANVNKSVADALPQYGQMQRDSEVQRYSSQRALREAMANTGDLSGTGLSGAGRGDVLSLENAAAGRLTDIGTQKQKLQDDAAFSIAELQKSGSLQEAQAAANAEQARIAALLQDTSDRWSKNYQVGRDQVSDNRYNTEWDYQVGRDQVGDNRYDTEWQYQMQQDERNRLEQQAANLASLGDFSGYEALGYNAAQIANMKQGYQAQLLAAASKSNGSGSGSGKTTKPTLTYSQTMQAIEDGIRSQQVLDGYRYYTGQDYAGEKDASAGTASAARESRIANAISVVNNLLTGESGAVGGVNNASMSAVDATIRGLVQSGQLADNDEAAEVIYRLGLA